MSKKIVLDSEEVLEVYDSVLIDCPECGKPMTPLGDGLTNPHHHCFDCDVSVPFGEVEDIDDPDWDELWKGDKFSELREYDPTTGFYEPVLGKTVVDISWLKAVKTAGDAFKNLEDKA